MSPSSSLRSSRPMLVRLGALLVAALALGSSLDAHAYVRSRGSNCQAVYWSQPCVYIQADSAYVADLSGADVERIIQQAINSWQSVIGASFIQLKYMPADGPREVTYRDGIQIIKFRTGQWCRPAVDGKQASCYDRSAAAITTVSFINKKGDANDGKILDADIELNAVNNQFVDLDRALPRSDGRAQTDLWNTLTHEMGHMLGLDHTCRGPVDPVDTCTVDDKGQARPLCSEVQRLHATNPAYKTILVSTMFAVAEPGDKEKRTPEADDIKGITDTYPKSRDPGMCSAPGSSTPSTGCSSTGSPTARSEGAGRAGLIAVWLVFMGALGLLLRRPRRAGA
jgi:hypothetical protein